jgi:hypothetical protein
MTRMVTQTAEEKENEDGYELSVKPWEVGHPALETNNAP